MIRIACRNAAAVENRDDGAVTQEFLEHTIHVMFAEVRAGPENGGELLHGVVRQPGDLHFGD